MKKILSTFIAFSLLFVPLYVSAAEFSITHIGALSTDGNVYSEWWYNGASPTIRGTASENAQVTYTIDDDSGSVTADASGNWSVPTNFSAAGDYVMSFGSSGSTLAFTLKYGQEYTASGTSQTTQSTTSVPETGSTQLVALIVSSALIGLGAFFVDRYNTRVGFEKSVVRDLD